MSDPLLDRYTPGTYANRDAMAMEREAALLARVERLERVIKGIMGIDTCKECADHIKPMLAGIIEKALSEDKHE